MPVLFEDQESDTEEGVAEGAEDLDVYKQWRKSDGRFIVFAPNKNSLPAGASDTATELTDSDFADLIAEAEAVFATHEFGQYVLSFQDVFDHDELDVSSGQPHRANGMAVQEDDASYRETSNEAWTEKFTASVPAAYSGPVRLDYQFKLGGEGYAHVRLLQGDDVLFSEHTQSTEYVESTFEPPEVGVDETPVFKWEIRAVDGASDGSNPASCRITGMRAVPQFEHDGETFWLDEVNRAPLDPTTVLEKIGATNLI